MNRVLAIWISLSCLFLGCMIKQGLDVALTNFVHEKPERRERGREENVRAYLGLI